MAGKSPIVKVSIVGDASSLKKALGEAEDRGKTFGEKMGELGPKIAAAGVAAIGAVVAGGVKSLIENEELMARTETVIRSTGEAAGVSAEHIRDMAMKLSDMSGAAHEDIQNLENVLLTFKNIKNEAGEGKDIFDQATVAVLDYSMALGVDMQSAAIQVGKALNDPIAGISALSRVGVTFSEDQKRVIKALTDTGDLAGAQRLILEELESQFAGTAEAAGQTLGGELNKLKNDFEAMQREVAEELIPTLRDLMELAPQAFEVIGGAAKAAVGGIVAIHRATEGVIGIFNPAIRSTNDLWLNLEMLEEAGWGSAEAVTKASLVLGSMAEEGTLTRRSVEELGRELGLTDYELLQAAAAVDEKWIPALKNADDAHSNLSESTDYLRARVLLNQEVHDSWTESLGREAEAVFVASDNARLLAESMGNLADTFTGQVYEAVQEGISLFEGMPSQIGGSLDELYEEFVTSQAELDEWAVGLERLAAMGMDNLAQQFLTKGPATLDLLRQALADPTKARQLNNAMWGIGLNAAQGLIQGLTALGTADIQRAWDSIKGRITDIAKQTFTITSPSKWMADQIGRPLGEGVVVGMADGLAPAGATLDGFKRSLMGGPPPRGSRVGIGAASFEVPVTVEIDGQVLARAVARQSALAERRG